MPELPEVETVRRGLVSLDGREIDRVDIHDSRSLKRHVPGPADFAIQLVGQRFSAPRRRGKYLWFPLDSGDAMLAHLGMTGQFRIDDPELPLARNTRVVWHFADGGPQLRFVDPRMFGGVSIAAGGAHVPSEIAHIALDPLDPEFNRDDVVRRLHGSGRGIKRLLLDQTVISGVGNIYADESLWRAKLHYERPGSSMTNAKLKELLGHVVDVFDESLVIGGTSFDAMYVNVKGEPGYFARELNAYGREDEPCHRCGTPIVREPFMNRSSFRCPRCQRLR